MPKYYVQCGMSKMLVDAEDARGAALWTAHQIIDQSIDLDTIDWTDADEINNLELIRVLLALDNEILVSEIGYGRCEAGRYDTPDIMTEWNQLIVAVSRLEMQMAKPKPSAGF